MSYVRRLSWIAFGLAAQLAVGIMMSVAGNTEGILGGALFALMYALPLVLIGLALRSHRARVVSTAGWVALAQGVCYTLLVIGNWSGYSAQMATFAVAVTAPTAVLDVAIFWATVLHRARPDPT